MPPTLSELRAKFRAPVAPKLTKAEIEAPITRGPGSCYVVEIAGLSPDEQLKHIVDAAMIADWPSGAGPRDKDPLVADFHDGHYWLRYKGHSQACRLVFDPSTKKVPGVMVPDYATMMEPDAATWRESPFDLDGKAAKKPPVDHEDFECLMVQYDDVEVAKADIMEQALELGWPIDAWCHMHVAEGTKVGKKAASTVGIDVHLSVGGAKHPLSLKDIDTVNTTVVVTIPAYPPEGFKMSAGKKPRKPEKGIEIHTPGGLEDKSTIRTKDLEIGTTGPATDGGDATWICVNYDVASDTRSMALISDLAKKQGWPKGNTMTARDVKGYSLFDGTTTLRLHQVAVPSSVEFLAGARMMVYVPKWHGWPDPDDYVDEDDEAELEAELDPESESLRPHPVEHVGLTGDDEFTSGVWIWVDPQVTERKNALRMLMDLAHDQGWPIGATIKLVDSVVKGLSFDLTAPGRLVQHLDLKRVRSSRILQVTVPKYMKYYDAQDDPDC